MRPAPLLRRTPRQRAAQVFGESVACGYVLGGLGGFVVAEVIAVQTAGFDLGYGFVVGLYGAGFAGAAGLIVGIGVGVVLGLLVALGERRLGPDKVARMIPAVALSMTLPLAYLFGMIGGTAWMLAVVVLDATFTFAGAQLLAHRYLRRAEGARVH